MWYMPHTAHMICAYIWYMHIWYVTYHIIWFFIIEISAWTISGRLFSYCILFLSKVWMIDNFILVSGLGIFYQGALEFWYSLIYNLGSKRGLTTVCVEGSIKYWWRSWLNINDIFMLLSFLISKSYDHHYMLHIICGILYATYYMQHI